MKKVLLTALAAATISVASAQNSAVNSAILNQKNGTLDKAQTEIDKAIAHDKTKNKAKTWFTRGTIYQDMVGHPVYGKMTTEKTPEIILESYNKTVELDGKDGQYGKQVPARLEMLYGQVLNQAVEHHNKEEWDQAISNYDLASRVNPTDTTAVKYAALASIAKKDYPRAMTYYDKLITLGHKTEDVYKTRVQLLQETQASDDKVMAALADGLKEHPNSVYLMQEELRYYLKNNRGGEAMAKLEKAIEKDPKNASLYAVLGNLQEKEGKLDAAYKSYQKAIEVDPKNFDAYYNLAVLEFNKGVSVAKKAEKMDYATYQKRGKAVEAEANKHFQASVPYFEKAIEIQPEDQATLKNLLSVYTRLGRKADAERINKKLK
ncbi:tetratricopeptide repeat protein [Pontibacter sp. KCTC 32443]|uniref:tetratricopeptide repeat protein n=1 Tax=Pontibacter TaxID=323449 RepID=UPI00164E4FCC|nr:MULTISPECIES: tetratricopeptide repeat protein [Pontibacter]MBC5773385.1 tetratricopeptide repeat protein [Pontibacter sp. KCTC 32443]